MFWVLGAHPVVLTVYTGSVLKLLGLEVPNGVLKMKPESAAM